MGKNEVYFTEIINKFSRDFIDYNKFYKAILTVAFNIYGGYLICNISFNPFVVFRIYYNNTYTFLYGSGTWKNTYFMTTETL